MQGESVEWLDEHNYRLTASNFGKVYFRVQRPSESMLKSIFVPKDLSNVRAIAHGEAKEKLARTIYARQMQKQVPGFVASDSEDEKRLFRPEKRAEKKVKESKKRSQKPYHRYQLYP